MTQQLPGVYELQNGKWSELEQTFFACRVVNAWNSLPDTVGFAILLLLRDLLELLILVSF